MKLDPIHLGVKNDQVYGSGIKSMGFKLQDLILEPKQDLIWSGSRQLD